ncbi:hypothetical protein HMPREF1640_02020 [Prevotella sp. S7-1-8]|nr:hypothetical protein HMPREF1640_02020 [Prevotella sp. S7-1-8]
MVFTFLKNGCQNHTHAHILPPNHLTKARMDFAHSKKQKLLLKIRKKPHVFFQRVIFQPFTPILIENTPSNGIGRSTFRH